MSDRFIDVELLGRKEYSASTIESDKKYNITEKNKIYNTLEQDKGYYDIIDLSSQKDYWVIYSIKYRPLGLDEWILQRGRRNDKGLRTADGVFNDWNI